MKSPAAELLAFTALLVALLTGSALAAIVLLVVAFVLEWHATAPRADAGSR